ncbi:unnamed protein product [Pipistrellus nathusii]|uniref:Uncharacterized protein n=1 Tax=Pipistrellus nathusii TaxID=59473 RepID=A0ABP0AK77_PIPNA
MPLSFLYERNSKCVFNVCFPPLPPTSPLLPFSICNCVYKHLEYLLCVKKLCLVADHHSAGGDWAVLFASLHQPRPQVFKRKRKRADWLASRALALVLPLVSLSRLEYVLCCSEMVFSPDMTSIPSRPRSFL